MSDVWWINHRKGTYRQESNAGIIYAGLEDSSHGRENVWDVSPDDITVHSPPSCVVAIGRVESRAEEKEVSFRDGPGRVAEVDYHEFSSPTDFQTLAAEIYSRGVSLGPIHPPSAGTHGLQRGYCHQFNHEALAVVRDLADSWPSWPQAKFPTQTQIAVDFEDREERGIDSSSPEKRGYEISRVVRDSQLARQVKKENDYQCQICGTDPIELADGTVYAEAHHLHPLAEGGPDKEENIICVCPTCHVKLDYRTQELEMEALNARGGSNVGRRHIEHHNERV